jgi:membrane fusion protein, multidrug efflux system
MVQPVNFLGEASDSASPAIQATPNATTNPKPVEKVNRTSAWRGWLYRIISTVVLVGAAGGMYWTRAAWQPKLDALIRPNANVEKPKPRPPLVTFAEATQERVPQYINCLGTVAAFNNVVVRSRVDGELIKVAFEEGQQVTAGQALAEIDPRQYLTARDQAAAQVQRDISALDLASVNYERTNLSKVRDVFSQQEIDESLAAYKSAQAALAVSRSQLANAELQLTYTKITAPISGTVGLRLVDQGNMIKASDSNGLLVITQLQPISVIFPIPQDEIPKVRQRLEAADSTTEVLAYDRSFRNLLAAGKLSAIDNQVDPTTGTLKIKANFENESNLLFPNQFVNIRLLVALWDKATVVPTSAIQRGPDFSYVYVINDDSTVDVQRVVIAFNEGTKSVIESGVSAGQKVVTEGTDRLQPKGKVSLPGAGSEAKVSSAGADQLSPPASSRQGSSISGPVKDEASTANPRAEKAVPQR